MGDGLDIFIRDVLPWIGNIFSLTLYLTPMQLVAKLRDSNGSGPGRIQWLPFVMQFLQGEVWCLYGFYAMNITVVPINIVGLTSGLIGVIAYYGACSGADAAGRKTRSFIEIGVVVTAMIPSVLSTILVFGLSDGDKRQSIFGIITNVISLAFFGSPLWDLITILKIRDASSLHVPTAVAVLCNGISWTVYGTHIGDIYIWLPNACAGILAIIQLIVRFTVGVRTDLNGADKQLLPTSSSSSSAAAAALAGGAVLSDDNTPLKPSDAL